MCMAPCHNVMYYSLSFVRVHSIISCSNNFGDGQPLLYSFRDKVQGTRKKITHLGLCPLFAGNALCQNTLHDIV